MAVSVRIRFEVFKRDGFTCQYCGCKSPDVVLECDHIVPRAEGGSDDIINLRTSCWACNSGKSDNPLSEVVTGEDPHDRAILLLEGERQLREYNAILEDIRVHREQDGQALVDFWCAEAGRHQVSKSDWTWLLHELDGTPAEIIRKAMLVAIGSGKTNDWRWTCAVLRNWRNDGKA